MMSAVGKVHRGKRFNNGQWFKNKLKYIKYKRIDFVLINRVIKDRQISKLNIKTN